REKRWAAPAAGAGPLDVQDDQRVRRRVPRWLTRAPLPEATQAGRDQAEIDRPPLREQKCTDPGRRGGRVGDRQAHGWRAYQEPARLDSGTFTATALTVSPAGVAVTSFTSRSYGSRGIFTSTERSCLIDPIIRPITSGMLPPSVVTFLM